MKITRPTLLLLTLAFLGLLLLLFQLQAIQAPNYLSSQRVLQSAGNLTLPTSFVNVGNQFTLYFEFDPKDSITMAIKFDTPGQYFSIGFGTRMPGSDIWYFELVNGEIQANDAFSPDYSQPPLDVNLGGTNDLERLAYEITSSYSLVKVRRALNTGDPNDAVIAPGLTNLIWATANSPFIAYHGSQRGIVTVPLIPNTKDSFISDGAGTGNDSIEGAHSIVNFIAWGVLVDIGILVVRLFRGTKIHIGRLVISTQVIHAILMSSVIIMSGVVTGLLLKVNRDARGAQLTQQRDKDFHFINGLVGLFLIILTLVSGIVSLIILLPYRKITSIYITKYLHRIMGLLLYFSAKANIITGVLFYDDGSWRVGVYIYFFVLFLIHIAIQIFCTYQDLTPNKAPLPSYKASKRPVYLALIEATNQGTPREELITRFPGLKWVILGNRVYDVTHWTHPGGNFIIQACLGREVGRFFFGNYALEGSRMSPHIHSGLTVLQMQKYCIGEITGLESLLVLKGSETEAVSAATNKWKIATITPVTPTVSEIAFQSPDFQVKNFGQSLTWLGRHFKVSKDTKRSKARLYTTAFSLTQANFNLRQNIYKYFEDVMNGNPGVIFTFENNYLVPQGVLPLFIKDHSDFHHGFSHEIHTTQISDPTNKFRIEGPFGTGLEMTPNATGTHCIVCAGTGVLPFIDFLNLFLWKTMYDLIKSATNVEKAEAINILKLPFDTIFNRMRIILVGAFLNPKEVLGLDIMSKLAELSNRYNLNNFMAVTKGYSDANITEAQGSFSSGFLSKFITGEEEKFYVVGPPRMNEEIPKALKELGVPNEKIMLV